MNKPTKPFSFVIVLTIGLIGKTWATPITVQSLWQGQGSLHPLLLTFDDATLDSNPDPIYGDYVNAISSLNFSYGGINYTLDNSKAGQPGSNEILIKAIPNWPGASVIIDTALIGDDSSQIHMSVGIENWPSPLTDSINGIFQSKLSSDGTVMIIQSSDQSFRHFLYQYNNSEGGEFSVVPIANAAILFSSSLIGLIGTARKKKK